MPEPKPFPHTVWRHHKGGLYVVIATGNLSEDRDVEVVVYRSCLKGCVWVRPLSMWHELVEVEGRTVPRFAKVLE